MRGYCIECGKEANHLHHVIPRAIKPDAVSTLLLCDVCHSLVHGKDPRGANRLDSHLHLTLVGLERAGGKMGGQLVTAWLCNYFGGSPEQWGLTEETYKKKLERALWLEEADPAYLESMFIEFCTHLRQEGDKIDPLEYWTNRDNPGYMMGRMMDAYNGHQTNLFN